MSKHSEHADDRAIALLIATTTLNTYSEILDHLDRDGLLDVQRWLFEPATRAHLYHPGFANMHRIADSVLSSLLADKDAAKESGGGGGSNR